MSHNSRRPSLPPAPRPSLSFVGPSPVYDLVIFGGRVIDPESRFDRAANIGINGDKIAAVTGENLRGRKVINAKGLVVSPGFIDLCVAGRPPTAQESRNVEAWKVSDGITSVLFLHDGTGAMDRYRHMLLHADHYANIGFSTRVWDYLDRGLSVAEKGVLIRRNLEEGALGVSVSPEYTPVLTTAEMIRYAGIAREKGVPFFMHLRYSSRLRELEGVEEAIRIAESTGVRLHIFHLPSTGGTFHMKEALAMLRSARDRGVRINADLYAYTYWATYVNAARFNAGWQERYGLTYGDLFHVPSRQYLTEETFAYYRTRGGLVVVPENTIPLEGSVLPALREDFVYIASDSACAVPFGTGQTSVGHPRATNNSAKALHLSKRAGVGLVDMLGKMTLGPARLMDEANESFGLRGRLRVGCCADITVFDYDRVDGEGTVMNRAVPSKGIRAVVINGRLVYREGEILDEFPGTFLLRTPR